MISKYKSLCVILVFVGFSTGAVQVRAADQVIENFENLSGIGVEGGVLTSVTKGPGVTEGKQAAEIPNGASIKLSMDGTRFVLMDWLKIDTLNTRPVPVSLVLAMAGEEFNFRKTVYIQPGNDTIAMPLSVCWPDSKIPPRFEFKLTSRAGVGVTVDNLRVEKAVKPSAGATLKDFGAKTGIVWPGFKQSICVPEEVLNSPRLPTYVMVFNYGFLDPLVGDSIGYNLDSNINPNGFWEVKLYEKNVDLAVWLWVTRYGREECISPFYSVKAGEKYVVKPTQSLTDILTFGKKFDWTPANFDAQYVSQLTDCVKLRLPAGEELKLNGGQAAAVAYCQPYKAAELQQYVDMVQEDLARYRRQFCFGARNDAVCTVAPTDDESKAGIMVFQPPPDEWFSATWECDTASRVGEIHATAINGIMTTVAVAAVPLKKSAKMQAQMSGFRAENGAAMPGNKKIADVFFLERVPRVVDGRAVFQPWIVASSHGPTEAGQIVWLAIRFSPPDDARAGLYKGSIDLTCTSGKISIPVSLEVVSIGSPTESQVVIGSTSTGVRDGIYGNIYDKMTDAQRYAMIKKIRGTLVDWGIPNFVIPGVSQVAKPPIAECARHLKLYPKLRTANQVLIEFDEISNFWERDFNSPGYKFTVKEHIAQTKALASKAGVKKPLIYLRLNKYERTIDRAHMVARAVEDAGGSPAITIPASYLSNTGEAEFRRLIRPFKAVLIKPDLAGINKTIAIMKDVGCEVYTGLASNDRYSVGLYSFGIGADGVYLEKVFSPCSPYYGFGLCGRGLLIPNSFDSIDVSLAMLRVQQGLSDFHLAKRVQQLVERAEKANVPAGDVKSILEEIRAGASEAEPPGFDESQFRANTISESGIELYRSRLTEAAGSLAEKLGTK